MHSIEENLVFKRGLKFKNRVIMAPMTTKMSFFDGEITSDEIKYYTLRSGEVGGVITAAANVSENGKGWKGELGVYDDKFIPGLSRLSAAIKRNGTKAILQIFHAGRMTDSTIIDGEIPVSASNIPSERPNSEKPRPLSSLEVLDILDDFKQATIRAIKAGFDGVEIHGANTYLIQQFFSPHSNRREDEWGGSVEKRFKFVNDLVEIVTDVVDNSEVDNFIVGYRFSPEEYENPGIKFSDTLYLVDQLANKKLDYLHISLSNYARFSVSKEYKEKSMLAYVYEKINSRLPLISVGDIRTRDNVDEALINSEAVAIGRSLLIDPHWTSKIVAGKEDLIRREISNFDREELFLTNGVWGFLEVMMPERLI